MLRALRPKLAAACRDRTLLKFASRYSSDKLHGYVVAVGPQWFLAAEIYEAAFYLGFAALRLRDIVDLEPDEFQTFVETALCKRNLRPREMPAIDLTSLSSILISGGEHFPLVTIKLQKQDNDVCYIGKVVSVSPSAVSLQKIMPGAVWEHRTVDYRLSEITRVEFGGPYEESLFLVGGPAPANSHGPAA